MLKYFRLFLLPFNLAYALVVYVRNKCYDWGIFKSTQFNLPVIVIGNLAVGGSGKTPTTEYLVNLLSNYKIAILSRGYGRKTKGFILADNTATAETIGDEPLQYYRKFGNVTVAVCEDRVRGVLNLRDNHDLILLDDAYQHRSLKAGFNILLFEFTKLNTFQYLLPAGNLREPFYATKRAQCVLVTKAKTEIDQATRKKITDKLALEPQQKLCFSSISYGALTPLYKTHEIESPEIEVVFLLTGIANPLPLKTKLKEMAVEIHSFEYPDHHRFKVGEIKQLIAKFQSHPAQKKVIVTTEKDGQRLLADNLKDLLLNLPIYYLPIKVELTAEDKYKFDQNILDYVASAK